MRKLNREMFVHSIDGISSIFVLIMYKTIVEKIEPSNMVKFISFVLIVTSIISWAFVIGYIVNMWKDMNQRRKAIKTEIEEMIKQ